MSDSHRQFAARYFNEVWRLLDAADRGPDAAARMIHLAHASLAHWLEAGGPQEWSVGEWQIARVYAVLGRSEAAVYHAERALALAETHALGPFWRASAREGLARALKPVDPERAAALRLEARTLADEVADSEDRAVLLQDLLE